MVRADFPLPLLGMVHLDNVVEHRRPIGAAEELEIAAWPENLRPHRAGTQLDMVVEVSAGGETVWRGVSTYLAKGIGAGVAPEGAPGEAAGLRPAGAHRSVAAGRGHGQGLCGGARATTTPSTSGPCRRRRWA